MLFILEGVFADINSLAPWYIFGNAMLLAGSALMCK